MMQRKSSRTIESTIAHLVSTLTCRAIKSSYTDRLVIELLADDDSSAHRVLRLLAGEHGTAAIMRSIVNSVWSKPYHQVCSAAKHFDTMCYTLMSMLDLRQLISAHILYAAAFDVTTATSQALYAYGISQQDILQEIERLECDDNILLSVC